MFRDVFIIILFVIIIFFSNYQRIHNSYYCIEVGATKQNFGGRYIPLFLLMDSDSDGKLSHSEIMYFYKYLVETNENYPDKFFFENGKWKVSTGLKNAALEYYTHGEIKTPELKEAYGGYFININSGVGK